MRILKYAFILLIAAGLGSCHKDDVNVSEGEVTTNPPAINVQAAVNGDVLGYVYDEDNSPVAAAAVAMLDQTTVTNQYGVFKFKNVELDQQGTYLTVSKSGYILGSDMLFALDEVNHTSKVKLLRLSETGTFAATAGGEVEVEGGGKVTFAANSIMNADGSDYTGTVKVTAKRVATDDPAVADVMPGGLMANAADGSTIILGSMGMVAVELRDEQGRELNIAASKTAEITFPIASNQHASAPAEIKLWSFDEVSGRWEEEGKATKNGDFYVAEVSHFSFWNCDAPFPLVNICGKVLYEDGGPGRNLQIKITTNGYGTGYGWTNQDGSFNGKVPKGEVLQIFVYNTLCNGDESIEVIEVGPFQNKTVLDDIIISNPSEFDMEGLVICSGNPVPNATVVYSFDGNSYITEAEPDGSFELGINDDCGNLETVSIFVVDPSTGLATAPIVVSGTSNPVIEFDVCGSGCDFIVSIEENSSLEICQERGLIANVDGSGNYTFEWDTGDTDASINVTNKQGIICVTVTDTDLDCSQIACSTFINPFTPLQVAADAIPACGGGDGAILAGVFGGQAPYSFTSVPDLGPIDLTGDSIIQNVPIGNYTIKVTDVNGCTAESEVTVESFENFELNLSVINECQGARAFVTVSGGNSPYQYIWSNGQADGSEIFIWQDGTYCVTVIDANGCMQEECIEIVIDSQFDLVQLDIVECSNGTYRLTNSNTGIDLQMWYQGTEYQFDFSDTVDIDFTPLGFNDIWAGGFSPSLGCEFEIYIPLPAAIKANAEVTYTLSEPTCQACTDGSITLNDAYLNYTEINGAMIGSVVVVNEDYVDVTMEAAAGQLSKGKYYVAVLDAVTNCFIYSQTIDF